MPGGRGQDNVGRGASDNSRGSDKGSDKGSDRGSDKGSKGSDRGSDRGGFGSIGDHQSYGMDKESFDHSIGSGRDKDRGGDSHDTPTEKPDKSLGESIGDWARDTWQDTKDFFGGKEDKGGFSPMGGASSYGMSEADFDATVGKRRYEARSLGQRLMREVDYFQEAPLDYASDLLDNPLVSGAALMSGAGLTAFGVQAVDAIADYVQREASPIEALGQVASSTIGFTPVGDVLGPMKSIVKAGIKSPEKAAVATGGMVGGKVGVAAGANIASAVTDNPYARAAITAATGAGSAYYGKEAIETAIANNTGKPSVSGMEPVESEGRGDSRSPLVSSGKAAVASSKKLMQPAQSDLYARTVKQLPYYGLNIQPSNLPYYGV